MRLRSYLSKRFGLGKAEEVEEALPVIQAQSDPLYDNSSDVQTETEGEDRKWTCLETYALLGMSIRRETEKDREIENRLEEMREQIGPVSKLDPEHRKLVETPSLDGMIEYMRNHPEEISNYIDSIREAEKVLGIKILQPGREYTASDIEELGQKLNEGKRDYQTKRLLYDL